MTTATRSPGPGTLERLVRRAGRRGVELLPPSAQKSTERLATYLEIPDLLRSGLFDVEYYQAQRGRRFDTSVAAARDFLMLRANEQFAPNPLFEPTLANPSGDLTSAAKVHAYVTSGAPRQGTSPLFDEKRYLTEQPLAAEHPGGALGHFLTGATEETPLPVPAGHPGAVPSWGQVRTALLELAHERARLTQLVARPRSALWRSAPARQRVRALIDTRPPVTTDPTAPADVDVIMVVAPGTDIESLTLSIESLRAQRLSTWRLIAVLDETDSVPEVLIDAAQDRRIQVAKIAPDLFASVALARNTAMPLVTGTWVAFLDPGVTWAKHTLHALMNGALTAGRRAACCAVEITAADGDQSVKAHAAGREHLFWRDEIDGSCLLIDREYLRELGGFSADLRNAETFDLALRMEDVEPIEFVPFLGAFAPARQLPALRDGHPAPDHWYWTVVGRHHVDWNAAAARPRVPGRITISIPTFQDWRMTARAITAVLGTCGDHDVEIVVVDNGSARAVSALLTAQFLTEPRVRVLPQARNLNFAIGSNLGAVSGTGETVLFLNNDTEVQPGWLEPMLAQLDDPTVRGVQPLLLFPDGTVQSAGCLLPGSDRPPFVFLNGFLPEDARRGGPFRLRIATAAALLMRAEEVFALNGFDPRYVNGQEDVDLCLRAVEARAGSFAVATDSVVVHHESKTAGRGARVNENRRLLVNRWRGRLAATDLDVYDSVGLQLVDLDYGPTHPNPIVVPTPRPVITRPRTTVAAGPAAGAPSLRWAIKLAAHPGLRGDAWGDVHFAAALGRSLERLGQQVVVDRRESRDRETRTIDDVTLVIRGLEKVDPHPDQVNLMWLISHPEMVADAELAGFDVVFAASEPWARDQAARTGSDVRPLLQATEPERFSPALRGRFRQHDLLFVGRSRNVLRPIVKDVVEARLDLDIYGDGWEQFGLGDLVVEQYLPNELAGAAYASAGVVLNDHWRDMADHGFISNRLFDAVACGARVVSDEVAGLSSLFGGCVQTYQNLDDLRRLLGKDRDQYFPDDEARRIIAEKVAVEHSFDARARELLDAALDVRLDRGWQNR